MKKIRAQTFEGYLKELPPEERGALQKLRKAIRAAAPKAEECISYGVPAFRLNGKLLVGMGVGARHCSFYSGATLRSFKQRLKQYETGKGTIRFQPSNPLPASLVRRIVTARIAQRGLDRKSP